MKLGGFSIILIFKTLICFSQMWSDPITISHTGFNYSPNFTIDNQGVIHCVWVQKLDYNFRKINYSKSINNGESWTSPVLITTNTNFWIDDPHIIADISGNLYVSFDYNVGAWPDVKICYIKFTASDSTWGQQSEIGTGMSNRIIIDQNNRVYFFWFAGTEFYRYLENDVLSDTFSLSSWIQEACFFENIIVDKNNKIHCIGNRKAGDHSHGAHFTCMHENWNPYIDLSDHSFYESGISLNSIGNPSFAWRQLLPSNPNLTGTYFTELENDSIQIPVFFGQGTSYPAIALDYTDRPHIVESQKIDSGYQLIHRYYKQDIWQEQVIEVDVNQFNKKVLVSKNSCIYLVYDKAGTTLFKQTESDYAMIIIRKLELPPGTDEQKTKLLVNIFPNPFSDKAIIEVQTSGSGTVHMKIFDIHGRTILQNKSLTLLSGTKRFIWEGEDDAGKQVENGYYFIQLSEGSNQVVKKVLRIVF